jgi:hypothetical protein
MDESGDLTTIASRIWAALQLLLKYLQEAIATTEAEWREKDRQPSDDSATFSANVRMHVLAQMRKHLPLAPRAMSPLHIPLGPYQLKVLHAHNGGLPRPKTEPRRTFYARNDYGIMSLNVTPPDALVEVEEEVTELQEGNLALVWDASGADLSMAHLYLTSLSNWPGKVLDLMAATVEETEEDFSGIRAAEREAEDAATGTMNSEPMAEPEDEDGSENEA